jgi:arsenate reductase
MFSMTIKSPDYQGQAGNVGDAGWLEALVNKRGTTFRKLPDMVKENIGDDTAVMVMAENPSMIKRPVLEHGEQLVVGFKASDYEAAGLAARNS